MGKLLTVMKDLAPQPETHLHTKLLYLDALGIQKRRSALQSGSV